MTKKNLSFLGMPTNDDIESLLEKNYQNIRPLEYRETLHSNTDNQNMFAFWTPVKDNVESYTDYKAYLDERGRRMSETPKIVKYNADTTVGRLKQSLSTSPIVLSDKVGIVKPKHAETLNGTTTKKVDVATDGPKVTKTGTTGTEIKHDTNHSVELPDSQVGVVKPKHAETLNGTATKKVDVATNGPKVTKTGTTGAEKKHNTDHSIVLPDSQVGVVKPKHTELLNNTTTKKQITNSEITAKTVEKSDAANPSGNKLVGVVKPKSDMGKQDIPNVSKPHNELNFNTAKIRHIRNK